MGKLAVELGMWILFESVEGKFRFTGVSKSIAEGRRRTKDLETYLLAQGRFSHLIQKEIDEIKKFVAKKWKKLTKMLDGEVDAIVKSYL
ncbi:hypothetical protein DRP07_09205 [Archaeoglobales archaeon]|nr:MAG: hypothetical protein DRP07_09205 [Archaeoglobales archaeon]